MRHIATLKFSGPTNTQGSRFNLTAFDTRRTLSYDHSAPSSRGWTDETLTAKLEEMYTARFGDMGPGLSRIKVSSVEIINGPKMDSDTDSVLVEYDYA